MNTKDEIIRYVATFVTCDSENLKEAELADLQSHKHSKTCRKMVRLFAFPLPPLPRTMLLHTLDIADD